MKRPILLTAFEPFGLRGVFKRGNASKDILELIQSQYGGRYEYQVLPVSKACETELEDALESLDPAAVVSMGEYLLMKSDSVRLESGAIRAPAIPLPAFGRSPDVLSPAAGRVARDTKSETAESIGLYYCNRVYLTALTWMHRRSRPAVFLHVSVRGDRNRQLHQVMGIIGALVPYAAMSGERKT